MDDFWEKKVNKVVEISKEFGYKELNKEFWMNKPAVMTSFVIDIYKSKKFKKEVKSEKKRPLMHRFHDLYFGVEKNDSRN